MTVQGTISQGNDLSGIIKLAVLAVGGQGGGVLTGWIEALARANGYVAQATSVAGVAQRTGATVYYVEMAPAGAAVPVFSLSPSAGDVDIMITAEMMEAGRSIIRGFVTPDRTTLITSSIGAGSGGDIQFLFAEDILGDGPGPFARHSKQYRDFHAMRQHMQQERVSAFREYIADVQTQAFPGPEHVIQAGPELVNAFLEKIEKPS